MRGISYYVVDYRDKLRICCGTHIRVVDTISLSKTFQLFCQSYNLLVRFEIALPRLGGYPYRLNCISLLFKDPPCIIRELSDEPDLLLLKGELEIKT